MAEQQGERGSTGQEAGPEQRVVHRSTRRRCGARSSFEGMVHGFRTPQSERFHWYILSDLEDFDCVVELFDDERGSEDA